MVRPAQREDLEALAQVLDQPFFRGYGLNRQGALRLLERALMEGELYGLDPPLALAWYRPKGGFDRGYLRLLAVAETAQGRGLGSLLMDFLEARGLSARALVSQHGVPKSGLWKGFSGAPTAALAAVGYLEFVLAERTNAQALRFYARRGFQEVGRLPGFVRPGREEVILWQGPAT
jgi:ribosomal protein S18 acetylase RimI-like enzyme